MISAAGQIVSFSKRSGWGLILSHGRKYFAHIKHFTTDCGCSQRHRCEISVGMRVNFSVDPDEAHTGGFPTARNIAPVSQERTA